MSRILVFLVLGLSCAAAQEAPILGLAARYPGDVGIENDPAVLLFDGFERYQTPSQAAKKNGGVWDQIGFIVNERISTQYKFGGAKSFEVDIPVTSSEWQSGLRKLIGPNEPVLFARAYMRYEPDFGDLSNGHKGIQVSGRFGGPCGWTPRDGSRWFLFLLENGGPFFGEAQPGYTHIYSYWPLQQSECGDHWFPNGQGGPWHLHPEDYPDFVAMPNFNVPRGVWFEYEFMVRLNDLGVRNGEVKVWKDGVVVADFPDLFIRSVSDLLIDTIFFGMHTHWSRRVNRVWWDNVVIARQYIGPMVSPTTATTPRRAAVIDFNSDGHPDYVVQNAATRQTAIWYLNNNVFISGAYGPTLAAGWGLRSVADFNRDTHPDYALFASRTDQTAIWYLSGRTFLRSAYGPTLPSGWQLVATADFNGNGYPDYVLYNSGTRRTAIWYLNNSVFVSAAWGPTLPAGWSLVGAADFDRNGHTDYLLFNSITRQTAIWYLSGPTFLRGAYGPRVPSGWELVATADFNGNG
jgi:hypothetical protein